MGGGGGGRSEKIGCLNPCWFEAVGVTAVWGVTIELIQGPPKNGNNCMSCPSQFETFTCWQFAAMSFCNVNVSSPFFCLQKITRSDR